MQNAALSRQEELPALASTQKGLAFTEVAITARSPSGPCGGAARQDALVAEDVGGSVGSGKDQGACAAYKKAKKQEMGQRREMGYRKRAAIK